MNRAASFLLCFCVIWTSPLRADVTLDGAAVLYASGDYTAAAERAVATKTADGDALAARALLASAVFAAREEREALVAAGAAAARRAIERDPHSREGHLQLAIALGYQGRAMGQMAAHESGLAHDARTAIDAALAVAPDDAWARAVSGAWHLEIVKRAGPLLAYSLYDASREAGLAELRLAAMTGRDNPVVMHQCALQLLNHDSKTFSEEAERWLIVAARLAPRDAFERHTVRQASRLLRAVRTGREIMILREVERQQLSY